MTHLSLKILKNLILWMFFFSIKSSNKKYIDNRISVYLLKEDNNEDLFLNLKYFNKIFFLNKKKNFLKYIIYVIYRCIKKLIF